MTETHFFATYDDETIRRAIHEHWQDFLQLDLPVICETIRQEIFNKTWS